MTGIVFAVRQSSSVRGAIPRNAAASALVRMSPAAGPGVEGDGVVELFIRPLKVFLRENPHPTGLANGPCGIGWHHFCFPPQAPDSPVQSVHLLGESPFRRTASSYAFS